MNDQGFMRLAPGQKKGNKMEETIKELSLEELKQILKLAQKEIDRRTIKRVEIS
jgi:hypothetical protein